MKYSIALIFLTIIMMIFPLGGCGLFSNGVSNQTQDKAAWTEKQAIEYLYGELTTRAKILTVTGATVKLSEYYMGLSSDFFAAQIDWIKASRNLGKKTNILFAEPIGNDFNLDVYESALKKLATYEGNKVWMVSINDAIWLVHENDGGIFAGNDKALNLLNEITLKVYNNLIYGYYIDYPPLWTVDPSTSNPVSIYSASSTSVDQYILIGIAKDTFSKYKNVAEYIIYEISALQSGNYQFALIENTGSEIHYTYTATRGSTQYEVKHYFIQHNNDLCEVLCGAIIPQINPVFSSYIFDASSSFRFQP